ncbi:MAG TPA: cytochrome c-type biogenesis protein [Acidisarcina sp.]
MKVTAQAQTILNFFSADAVLRILGMVLVSVVLFSMTAVTDPGARFNDVGHRLMCTCSCNQVLLECNHVGCPISGGMRDELQARIDHGENDDLVLQAFVQKYGAVVLAAPLTKGFNKIAWVMPFLVLVLGFLGAALLIRKWRLRTVAMPALPDAEGSEERRARIRKDTEL